MNKTLIDSETYPLAPDHINSTRPFFDCFGNREAEDSAIWLVRFCQERGEGWKPFTREELEVFCAAKGFPGHFWFNGLVDHRFIVEEQTDTFEFTHEFVARCFLAAPALPVNA